MSRRYRRNHSPIFSAKVALAAIKDQGSQFTDEDFTGVLKKHGIQISMDGRGRWHDNVFIDRFWRSLKYEDVYARA